MTWRHGRGNDFGRTGANLSQGSNIPEKSDILVLFSDFVVSKFVICHIDKGWYRYLDFRLPKFQGGGGSAPPGSCQEGGSFPPPATLVPTFLWSVLSYYIFVYVLESV